jgi:FtsP/CotA-like multicopper oxidase with cupredoxin domain
MPLLDKPPSQPGFLTAITDEEFKLAGSITRTLVFNSNAGPTKDPRQHTINGIQFADKSGHANLDVVLGAVEEWKVVNTTSIGIDHPLHIHINPFQVIEMFDPNERIFDWANKTSINRYVFDQTPLVEGQCRVDPDDESTWKPCGPTKQGHWWDVSRIPTGLATTGKNGPVLIPGYFKMRSRFVDYPGRYVMHCHILIHEDRGMMFSVQIVRPKTPPVHH